MEYPNSGALFAQAVKKSDKSPDYWGDITITVKDFQIENGQIKIALSGWKKTSKTGKQFLSIACQQKVEKQNNQTSEDKDEDIPF
jgi:uncharacterized protein (DUF736 family)